MRRNRRRSSNMRSFIIMYKVLTVVKTRDGRLLAELSKYSKIIFLRHPLNTCLRLATSMIEGEKAGHDHDRLSQARRGMHRDRADRAHAFPTHHAAAHCRDVDESGPRRRRQSVVDRNSGISRDYELELTARANGR